METPRILAIDDVRLSSPPERAEEVLAFYSQVLGLRRVADGGGPAEILLCGCQRVGPFIVIRLESEPPVDLRRTVCIQMDSLSRCSELMDENGIPWVQSQGWFFYDRRLTVADPGGNRVDLVCLHEF